MHSHHHSMWRPGFSPGDLWWIDEGRPGVFSRPQLGWVDGQRCNRGGCDGEIVLPPVVNCSCHLHAPCSECTDRNFCCSACSWEDVRDEPAPAVMSQSERDMWAEYRKRWEEEERKPLDNTKVSWRSKSHSSCSMIKEGVYPEGMTRAQVEAEVRGTFGGRFESFGGGKFKYIAYTD